MNRIKLGGESGNYPNMAEIEWKFTLDHQGWVILNISRSVIFPTHIILNLIFTVLSQFLVFVIQIICIQWKWPISCFSMLVNSFYLYFRFRLFLKFRLIISYHRLGDFELIFHKMTEKNNQNISHMIDI